MVGVCGQLLVRMAIQTVGRVGFQCNGVNNLLSRAVMTGGTGTIPVGRNIMFDAHNLIPVSDNMTDTAELTGRIEGEIIGADFHCMRKRCVVIVDLIRVAVGAGDRSPIQALLNGLPNGCGGKGCAGVVVTDGTSCSRHYTVQSVDVSRAGQGADTSCAEHRVVAGMTDGTRSVYCPVVMRRGRCMDGSAVLMAGIAGEVA